MTHHLKHNLRVIPSNHGSVWDWDLQLQQISKDNTLSYEQNFGPFLIFIFFFFFSISRNFFLLNIIRKFYFSFIFDFLASFTRLNIILNYDILNWQQAASVQSYCHLVGSKVETPHGAYWNGKVTGQTTFITFNLSFNKIKLL